MEKERIPKPRTKLGMIGAIDHGGNTLTAAIGRVMSKHTPNARSAWKIYEAIVGVGSAKSRQRISVLSENLTSAKELLEKEYGLENVFSGGTR
jgi:translation elongation factor EF-Tu-like GTPase